MNRRNDNDTRLQKIKDFVSRYSDNIFIIIFLIMIIGTAVVASLFIVNGMKDIGTMITDEIRDERLREIYVSEQLDGLETFENIINKVNEDKRLTYEYAVFVDGKSFLNSDIKYRTKSGELVTISSTGGGAKYIDDEMDYDMLVVYCDGEKVGVFLQFKSRKE